MGPAGTPDGALAALALEPGDPTRSRRRLSVVVPVELVVQLVIVLVVRVQGLVVLVCVTVSVIGIVPVRDERGGTNRLERARLDGLGIDRIAVIRLSSANLRLRLRLREAWRLVAVSCGTPALTFDPRRLALLRRPIGAHGPASAAGCAASQLSSKWAAARESSLARPGVRTASAVVNRSS
jgi:hypothetical protein